MARRTDWKDIAELVGIGAIVASLLFVGLQMQLDRKIGATQAFMESAATGIDLTDMLNSNRDIWIRGLKGEQLSEIEESIFYDLAGAAAQRKVGVWRRRVNLGGGDPETWIEAYAFELYIYPGLRRTFEMRRNQVQEARIAFGKERPSDGFAALVADALADLDSRSPPMPKYLTFNLR